MSDTMKDIRKKNDTDLRKLLREQYDALQSFRFSVTGTKVRNVKEGQNIRKEIARILTELNARQKHDGANS